MKLFAITIFLTSTLLMYLILHMSQSRVRNRIIKRIEKAYESDVMDTNIDGETTHIINVDIIRPFAVIDNAIRFFQFHKTIARELHMANLRIKVSEFITIAAFMAIVPSMIAHFLFHRSALTIILICAGSFFPYIAVKRRQAARRKAFANQLVDSITLISNSLKSGFSFLQAMDLASREMRSPISEEFNRVLYEIKYGKTFNEAMEQLVIRMQSDDLELIMACVMIQRQIGGNLAEILDKISHTIHERIKIKGQIKAWTAQGRLSGFILSFIPVAIILFLLIASPSYVLVLFTNKIGRLLLVLAVVNQVIGVLIIRRIVDVKI